MKKSYLYILFMFKGDKYDTGLVYFFSKQRNFNFWLSKQTIYKSKFKVVSFTNLRGTTTMKALFTFYQREMKEVIIKNFKIKFNSPTSKWPLKQS